METAEVLAAYYVDRHMAELSREAERLGALAVAGYESATRDAAVFAAALLHRRPDLTEQDARTAVDLFRIVAEHVHDPHDWDHIGTVVDLLDALAANACAEVCRAWASDTRPRREGVPVEALATAAREAADRYPDARLIRNQVGNMSVMVDGEHVAMLDLTFGRVVTWDQDEQA